MSQKELVLKVANEESSSSCHENHEAATNLNLVTPIIKTKRANSKSAGPHVQTHSRASSGTSNLSVKFTIDRDETDGSSPSISESVSVCSSPQDCSTYSKYSENSNFSKPPVPPASQTKSKRRKIRKSVESSGQDSGILCSISSAKEENIDKQRTKQDCNFSGECSSSDELSDVENRLKYSRDEYENKLSTYSKKDLSVQSSGFKQNIKNYLNQSIIGQQSKNGIIENKHNKDTQCNSNISRLDKIIKRAHPSSGNEFYHGHQKDIDNEITTAIYNHSLSANVSNGNEKSGHRRNVSDSHQPLLSDNKSFDSSSDDEGLNRSGHIRRKTKTVRNNARDTYSELVDCSGDGRNKNCPQRHRDRGQPSIIDIDFQFPGTLGRRNLHIPGEPLKTFVAFVFLFFAWVATTTSLALTHDRVPYQDDPLPDIILDNVTYQHWGLDVSEIIIMVSTWSAFLITIFHKHRFIVLRRVFLLVGIHYYYRAITMFLTVLPVADKNYLKNYCVPPSNDTTPAVVAQRVLKLLSGMGLAINGKHVYCGDYIYSGHTMTLIMGYFVIKHYSPRGWFLLHYASMVTSIAGVVTLLLARGHYSIDVIIAYWVTTRIWWIYHTLANNANLKELDGYAENPNNFLKKIWWWYIFRYFECNVPVNLPREYGLPVPQAMVKSRPVQYIVRKFKGGKKEGHRQSSSSADSIQNVE